MKYVIGVDGGNTKTDYLVFDLQGNFVCGVRLGTCSHEGLRDSYEGSYREMKKAFDHFEKEHNIKVTDFAGAAFGLAGVDCPKQKNELDKVIKRLGFNDNFIVVNDGFLGIKIGTESGVGVCSIIGTGTVCVGIDKNGDWLQVGGIGHVTSDDAGGNFLTAMAYRYVYDELYRFGKKTMLTDFILEKLNVKDKYYFVENYIEKGRAPSVEVNSFLFNCAKKGDEVAIEILRNMGENRGKAAASVMVNLNFDEPVEIALAGSVWVKALTNDLQDSFVETIKRHTNKKFKVRVVDEPPATGAILWALELAHKKMPDQQMKTKILSQIEKYQP